MRTKKEKVETKEKEMKDEKEVKEILQPEVNIGMIGHVDSGKTSLVRAITGVWTDTHSEELKRGISIRIGYADVDIYKCGKCKTENYSVDKTCPSCKGKSGYLRTVSFASTKETVLKYPDFPLQLGHVLSTE